MQEHYKGALTCNIALLNCNVHATVLVSSGLAVYQRFFIQRITDLILSVREKYSYSAWLESEEREEIMVLSLWLLYAILEYPLLDGPFPWPACS